MIWRAQPAVGIGVRLSAAEALLDQALADLTSGNREAPGMVCAAALAEATAELRVAVGLTPGYVPAVEERAALQQRIKGLVPRLQQVERLLAAAAEFYRGWCAAAPAPVLGYGPAGYATAIWPDRPVSALLAVEG